MIYNIIFFKKIIIFLEQLIIVPQIILGYLFELLQSERFIEFNADLLFLFPYYQTGGAEKVHLEVVRSIPKENVNIIFTASSNNNHFLSAFREHSNRLKIAPQLSGFKRYFYLGRLLFNINHSSIKKIFFSAYTDFYCLTPYVKKNIEVIDLIHAIPWLNAISLFFTKHISKRIIINELIYNQVLLCYKENKLLIFNDRLTVIENFALQPKENQLRNNKNGTLNILYVGRSTEEKRVEIIGQIARECNVKNPSIKFVMIGPGIEDKLKNVFKNHCNIEYTGEIWDFERLSGYYESSDVLLITSSTEGFPMVIIEAMAYGVVPICTAVGGIPLHIKNKETGYLVKNDNPDQIVRDITKILIDLDAEIQKDNQV